MSRAAILLLLAATLPFPAGRRTAADELPSFEWAISAGGDKHDKTRCIAVDRNGDVLLTGEFTGTATFGDHRLESVGDMDFFLAKVSPQGRVLWARAGGGAGIDRGYGVAADAAGNCYVTGHFNSSDVAFGDARASCLGDYDIFVAKYGPDGTLVWLETGGGPGYDYGHGIAVTSRNAVVFTGAVVGQGRWGGRAVGHDGPSHLFCASLDAAGTTAWFVAADGAASRGHGIATDARGRCFVGGSAGKSGSIAGRAFTGRGDEDPVVVCFDQDGGVRWLFQDLGGVRGAVHEIAADAAGNVWAAGMFREELRPGGRPTTSAGDNDILLFSLDADGKAAWVKTAGGPGVDYGLGVVAADDGTSVFSGSFRDAMVFEGVQRTGSQSGDAYLAGFDRRGTCRFFVQVEGRGTDHAYTVARDASGAIYVSGAASGPATFGPHAVPNRGSNDVFLAKLAAP